MTTNPWIFHRTWMDVMEEAFQEVLCDHEQLSKTSRRFVMEEAVLDEQHAWEERHERRMERSLRGIPHVHEDDFLQPSSTESEEGMAVFPLLRESLPESPLFARAFVWAEQVWSWARLRYDHSVKKDREVFSLLAGVYGVPAKIFFAESEKRMKSAYHGAMSQAQWDIAETYLRMSMITLETLTHRLPREQAVLKPLLQESVELMHALMTTVLKQRGSTRS